MRSPSPDAESTVPSCTASDTAGTATADADISWGCSSVRLPARSGGPDVLEIDASAAFFPIAEPRRLGAFPAVYFTGKRRCRGALFGILCGNRYAHGPGRLA